MIIAKFAAAMALPLLLMPKVEFPVARECGRDHVPDDMIARLAKSNGAHMADCNATGAAFLEYDFGGPEGVETIVATFQDGVGVFNDKGALYGRFLDESLRCGSSAKVVDLAGIQLPGAPPAVLFVVRDDAGTGREVEDTAELLVFDGLKLKVAWSKKVKEGERFDGAALHWDKKAKKFK